MFMLLFIERIKTFELEMRWLSYHCKKRSLSKSLFDLSTTSHFIVTILIERGAFCVPSKVSRETL